MNNRNVSREKRTPMRRLRGHFREENDDTRIEDRIEEVFIDVDIFALVTLITLMVTLTTVGIIARAITIVRGLLLLLLLPLVYIFPLFRINMTVISISISMTMMIIIRQVYPPKRSRERYESQKSLDALTFDEFVRRL